MDKNKEKNCSENHPPQTDKAPVLKGPLSLSETSDHGSDVSAYSKQDILQQRLLSSSSQEELLQTLQIAQKQTHTQQTLALSEEGLDLSSELEAILFASQKPLKIPEIQELFADRELKAREIIAAIEGLIRIYRERGGGIHITHQKGLGYQFQTVPAAAPLMEAMFSRRPRPLSRAAHETLAIIAYRQPVSRADIEFIRGVDAGSIIKNLLERCLITCVGRKEDSPGKPMVFGTTDEFLRVYRLNSLSQLPPLESFQPDPNTIEKAFSKIETMQHPPQIQEET